MRPGVELLRLEQAREAFRRRTPVWHLGAFVKIPERTGEKSDRPIALAHGDEFSFLQGARHAVLRRQVGDHPLVLLR